MIDIPKLNSLGIMAEPTGDGNVILYAPLSGNCALCTAEELEELEISPVTHPVVGQLCEDAKDPDLILPPEQYGEMTILLNFICNFKCTYCYSAAGRSKESIPEATLFSALNWYIDAKRTPLRKLKLIFSGGGEPLMSLSLLRKALEKSELLGNERGIQLTFGIVTNGTLLNAEFLALVRKYKINLVISFDVLEEVQNKQRGEYEKVCCTIDWLQKEEITPGIRCTITPLNVKQQSQIVAELNKRFPGLNTIAFEAVLNADLFADATELERFYCIFTDELFKARKLGKKFGITVGNTIIDNFDSCKERACLGKFTLTPLGMLTACSRISSPQEPLYEHFVYGQVACDGEVQINQSILDAIMNLKVDTYEECGSCIARYHCSGGCLLARYVYTPEYQMAYCRFMRRMIQTVLLELIKIE